MFHQNRIERMMAENRINFKQKVFEQIYRVMINNYLCIKFV